MKHFIKIAAIVLALCMIFSMASCDEIIGELSGVIGEVAPDGIGDLFEDVEDVFDRDDIMIEFNGIQVDDKMMSYYYNDYLADWLIQYGSYVSVFGLDLNQDLEDQWYGSGMAGALLGDFEGTWFDYFYGNVELEVGEYLIWASYANQYGLELDEEDLIDIEKDIRSIEEKLERTGTKYKDWYGKGVDEDVVRRCLELVRIASKGTEHFTANAEKHISDTDLKIWANQNMDKITVADCLKFTINVSSYGMNNESFDRACREAKEVAYKLANSNSAAEFEYTARNVKDMGYNIQVPDSCSTVTYRYGDESEVSSWLFEGYSYEGDTYTTEKWTEENNKDKEKDEYNVYETYTITVYCVLNAAHFDDDLSHSFAYAMMSNKSAASALMEEVMGSGEVSGEKFCDIAERINEEYMKITASMVAGGSQDSVGMVEGVGAGYFASKYDSLNKWIEDDSRMAGDISDIIEVGAGSNIYYKYEYDSSTDSEANSDDEKKDYIGSVTVGDGSFQIGSSVQIGGSFTTLVGQQYAVVLFLGHGGEVWREMAKSEVLWERVEEQHARLEGSGSWMHSGNRDEINVADLNFLREQSGGGYYFSGVGNVTIVPGGDYNYSIVDPEYSFSTVIPVTPSDDKN